MGVDILDLIFRLERTFRVRIGRESFRRMIEEAGPGDITLGALFEFVRWKAVRSGVFDEDMDAETIWLMFRRAVSDSLGIEADEVTKGRWIGRELGAW